MTKKVIIIGATSGIGRELALHYIRQGCRVGITGRRQHLLQALQQAYPQQVFTACFDVREEKCLDFLLTLVDAMQGMDLLIYNSGYGEVSKTLDPAIEWQTVQTNVAGLVRIVDFAFHYFTQQEHGHIAIISSVAALRGNSWAPAYSASKAFASTYAEGLNLKAYRMHKNILITDVKPGFVATKMAQGNKRFWVAMPQKAVRQIATALEKKKRTVYITHRWWLVAQLMKVIPYSIYKRLG